MMNTSQHPASEARAASRAHSNLADFSGKLSLLTGTAAGGLFVEAVNLYSERHYGLSVCTSFIGANALFGAWMLSNVAHTEAHEAGAYSQLSISLPDTVPAPALEQATGLRLVVDNTHHVTEQQVPGPA